MRNRRHDQIQDTAILGHHLPLLIVEVALQQQFLQAATFVPSPLGIGEEIDDWPADNLLATIAHSLQPVIRDGHDIAVAIHGVQHGRR